MGGSTTDMEIQRGANIQLALVTLVVTDYDEAIEFFTKKLNFTLIEDTPLTPTKRWVVVAPEAGMGCGLLLAKAVGEVQQAAVGAQTGGRVAFFLHTEHFDEYHSMLLANGVSIVRTPVEEPYGKVLVFEDLYGNLWDLVGRS